MQNCVQKFNIEQIRATIDRCKVVWIELIEGHKKLHQYYSERGLCIKKNRIKQFEKNLKDIEHIENKLKDVDEIVWEVVCKDVEKHRKKLLRTVTHYEFDEAIEEYIKKNKINT